MCTAALQSPVTTRGGRGRSTRDVDGDVLRIDERGDAVHRPWATSMAFVDESGRTVGRGDGWRASLWVRRLEERRTRGMRRFHMRRFPAVFSLVGLPIVLAALASPPIAAANNYATPLKGTWLFTQEFQIPGLVGVMEGREF